MEFTEVRRKAKVPKSNFDDLCSKQCEKFQEDRSLLYELNNLEFIYNLLFKMNSLGYYTVCSQPGNKSNGPVPVFKNYDHYSKVAIGKISKFSVNKIIPGYQQQRAQVAGFIRRNIGFKLYNLLKDDKHLVVRCGDLSSDYFSQGTQFFDNDGKNISSSKNCDTPYICHSGIRIFNENCSPEIYNIDISDKNEIIYFCVSERRMNNNSYIWNRLILLLEAN